MDNLTHALLGAALGRVCYGNRLGWRATAAAVIAAELPDADVLIQSSSDPLLGIEYHRHFTHSFAFAPIGALFVALIWISRERFRGQWREFWGCACIGWLSHILLDACTAYGTQLFRPFSAVRYSWNFISIIDPIFTLILLVGLLVCWWRKQNRFAMAGLLCGAGYLLLGAVQEYRALQVQTALAQSRDQLTERGTVMPTMGNNIIWRSVYLSRGRIYSDRIRVGWFSGASVVEGASWPMVTLADLTPAEAERDAGLHSFERFAWFADGWVARSPAEPAVIVDLRYSISARAFDPIWGIRFTEPGAPTEVEWMAGPRERRWNVGELWREITGADPAYKRVKSPTQKPS